MDVGRSQPNHYKSSVIIAFLLIFTILYIYTLYIHSICDLWSLVGAFIWIWVLVTNFGANILVLSLRKLVLRDSEA